MKFHKILQFFFAFTSLLMLTVNANAADKSSLFSPVNGATNVPTTGQNFDWSNDTGASVYRIVVSENSSFSGFNEADGSSSCSSTCKTERTNSSRYDGFTLRDNWTYYWRVRSDVSTWSSVFSFTTQSMVPKVEPSRIRIREVVLIM